MRKKVIKKPAKVKVAKKVKVQHEVIKEIDNLMLLTEKSNDEIEAIEKESNEILQDQKEVIQDEYKTDNIILINNLESSMFESIYKNHSDINEQITLDKHLEYFKKFLLMYNIEVSNLNIIHLNRYKNSIYNFKNNITLN